MWANVIQAKQQHRSKGQVWGFGTQLRTSNRFNDFSQGC